ncbi:hypothetical protein [Streptomyces sp. NPDC059168]|uniref:hypothetical protein n=1 Tax=Streptomyces sp. NPDC059168 TaxID=3346753 RepID=UPI0036A1D66A
MDQARREGTFTLAHEAFWAAAKHGLGESEGPKALVHVLLLHRHLRHRDVVAGNRAALAINACTADVVAVQARTAAESEGRSPTVTVTTPLPDPVTPPDQRLPSPTERRANRLPASTAGTNCCTVLKGSALTGPRHTLTEPASDAAIDTACRVLRLPTMRAQFADTVARAEREHLSNRLSLSNC